jgi:hypothetical protein
MQVIGRVPIWKISPYPHTVRTGGVQIHKEMAGADAGEYKGDDKMTK